MNVSRRYSWRGNTYGLVVHPNRRRQGIARQLMRDVEHVFAERVVHRITILIEVDARGLWSSGLPSLIQ